MKQSYSLRFRFWCIDLSVTLSVVKKNIKNRRCIVYKAMPLRLFRRFFYFSPSTPLYLVSTVRTKSVTYYTFTSFKQNFVYYKHIVFKEKNME